jgi:hypothetical protein
MNIMCVTWNKVIFYDFLLSVCGSGCIPVEVLVEDLNIWFYRDLLSLILKRTFQELLITFSLFAHKWRSKHTHILQYFWNRRNIFFIVRTYGSVSLYAPYNNPARGMHVLGQHHTPTLLFQSNTRFIGGLAQWWLALHPNEGPSQMDSWTHVSHIQFDRICTPCFSEPNMHTTWEGVGRTHMWKVPWYDTSSRGIVREMPTIEVITHYLSCNLWQHILD